MKPARCDLWSLGAKAAALVVVDLAVWTVGGSVGQIARHPDTGSSIASAIVPVALAVLFSLGLLWVAWRLWRRWSAGTVRIVTGLVVAYGAAALLALFSRLADGGGAPIRRAWAWNVPAAALLVLGAVAYRKLSRAVIRWSGVDDPLDVYGHPAGHMERVRVFCLALGWSVWLAGSSASAALFGATTMAGGISMVVSVGLAWIAYRATLWWMTPPARPALPPGRGFEVLPPQQQQRG